MRNRGLNKMMKSIMLFIIVLIFGLGSVSSQDIDNLKVKREHPFLFTSPTLIKDIKKKTKDLKSFHSYVKSSRESATNDPTATDLIRAEVDGKTNMGHVDYFINDCFYYGIDAYINDNELSKAYAKQYILSLLDVPISGDDDMPIRGKLFALGSLYDWMYYDLDDQLKKDIRDEILDLVTYVDSKWHYVSSGVVDGHSRFGNISVLISLLPIYHDIQDDNRSRYDKYLKLVVNNWINNFNPFQTWVNQDGSHSMGWAYGASYSMYFPYIVWEFATDEQSWFTDWQKGKPYFNMYGLRNDYNSNEKSSGAYDNFPFSADVWASEYNATLQNRQVLFSAFYYKDKHSRWFFNHMKERNISESSFKYSYWDILYNNFADEEEAKPNDLPLSHYYKNSAYVLMRDSWDFNKNTLMTFKSSSFYAAGHHHKDQNAFTIYYKGPLAIDAGAYGALGEWGSTHFWNYYTRSVAHNTMLIYDPSEKFQHDGHTYSNDGGQYFFKNDNPTLSQIKEGGVNHLDGILKYEEAQDYTYTQGDATKAYRETKLEEYKRSVVYLRNHSYNHPAIIIYDKVVSTNADFKKTYLLHSIKEPTVSGNISSFKIDDGMDENNKAVLYQETLLPENAEITKIGGRENNQEFYVADDGYGNPHNYNENAAYDNPTGREARALREAGEWRVEVSPSAKAKQDIFLNVLSITDGEDGTTAVKTKYISSNNTDGVLIQDNDNKEQTLVLFCKDSVNIDDQVVMPNGVSFNNLLVIGLKENTNYKIEKSGTGFDIKESAEGKLKSTSQGTVYLDSTYMPILVSLEYDVNTCSREVSFSSYSINKNVSEWYWDFGDGTVSTKQKETHKYQMAGTYTVTLIGKAGELTDTITKEITIQPAIDMPVVVSDEICGAGVLTLSIDTNFINQVSNTITTFKWYDAETGGKFLAIGDTLITPELSESKIYYVASVIPGEVKTATGSKTDKGTGNYYEYDDKEAVWGLSFSTENDINLKSVKVYNGKSRSGSYVGERTFTVINTAGDTITQSTVNVIAGEQRLNLNMSIPAGTGYRLLTDTHVGLWRDTEGAKYPYSIDGVVTITGGTRYDGVPPFTADSYYFFYDWEVEISGDSLSCRSSAVAEVVPLPKAEFLYNIYDTVVYFTNISNGDSFSWNFGDNNESSEKSPVYKYSDYNTYNVKLIATNKCGDNSVTTPIVVRNTGIRVEYKNNMVKIYPNPTNRYINFSAEGQSDVVNAVYIYNNVGTIVKVINTTNISDLQIDISDLQSGMYFLQIDSKENSYKPIKFIVVE
jgi:PKD repeat protein